MRCVQVDPRAPSANPPFPGQRWTGSYPRPKQKLRNSRTIPPRQASPRQGRGSIGPVRRPYGFRYIRKTSDAPARYEIDAAEAEVVRLVYDKYTMDGLSIGAIARLLREMGPPTRPAGDPLGAIGRMGDAA